MKTIKTVLLCVVSAAACLTNSPAIAGPYTDELGRCLVSSTTTEDRNALVRWMFAAASSHPAIKNFATVSPSQIDDANKVIAQLFTRLLTVSCKAKTQEAIKFEGKSAIEVSFNLLGQVAGREMFSDPRVGANIAGMEKYFDGKKLQQLGDLK